MEKCREKWTNEGTVISSQPYMYHKPQWSLEVTVTKLIVKWKLEGSKEMGDQFLKSSTCHNATFTSSPFKSQEGKIP